MTKISEIFPKAMCNHCGWAGNISDLAEEKSGKSTEEVCPECGSPDTEWLTLAEYDNIVDGEAIDEC